MSVPATMIAIAISEPGDPEVLRPEERTVPAAGPDEVLIAVEAAGVNRPDCLQRAGAYPPPPGASDLPGLEVAGRVVACGEGTSRLKPGDAVCALVSGGGYAPYVTAPESQALPVPAGLSMIEAGAIPETFFTVWVNVFGHGRLEPGETLLVHGGSSGIGTTAIQFGKALGARVICTAGSPEKLDRCRALGADVAISYRDEDFVAVVEDVTGGHGADVILDIMGAKYLARNLAALATYGRLVIIGRQGGSRAELDLGVLQGKQATIHATTLRNRPVAEKSAIVAAVGDAVWPLVSAGTVTPVIEDTVPMAQAADAHRILEAGGHTGKVLLVR